MRILTHNLLMCNVKGCVSGNFPLVIRAKQVEKVASPFKAVFVLNILPKLDWPALVKGAADVRTLFPPLPSLKFSLYSSDSFCLESTAALLSFALASAAPLLFILLPYAANLLLLLLRQLFGHTLHAIGWSDHPGEPASQCKQRRSFLTTIMDCATRHPHC